MSDRVAIVAETRTVTGKKVKQLRREGIIPGVVYGRNEPIQVQMENKSLRRALRVVGTTQLADLQIGDDTLTVLVREIQQHVTRGDLEHVDFMEVDMQRTITSEAALVATGTAAPEAEGMGMITLTLHGVEIECLPGDLVSEIEVDLSQIESPDHVLFVSDLVAPKGVTILTDPETPLTSFQIAREEEEEEGEEEEMEYGAEPEVITARDEDEDEA